MLIKVVLLLPRVSQHSLTWATGRYGAVLGMCLFVYTEQGSGFVRSGRSVNVLSLQCSPVGFVAFAKELSAKSGLYVN